jgi:hypothetical protein
MSRRFQFSLRALLGEVTLIAVGLACVGSIGTNLLLNAVLVELSAASFGAAIGMLFDQPVDFAIIMAGLALPVGCIMLAVSIIL